MSTEVRDPAPDGVPSGKRELTKAANRAAILEAALVVFGELGYGAATVRDIVRRTDLASGTFYNYFPDKESVLRALVEDVAVEVRALVREARRAATDLESFIESGFRAYFEFLEADPLMFELLRRNAGTIRALYEEPAVGAGAVDLEEDLRAGIAAGVVPDHDVEYMSRSMVGAGFEIAILMLERDPVDVDGAVRFVSDLFLGGIERQR
ncbi:TetR/AcrR family transcriptional regulator [Paraconexibacter antarcticus]|uniref:TetR/AcrR family transcriptional regulator n=1 Tax=Paraconexibacter antarcticus TaxID=2949664 RepID=A0ABY5DYE6_9ACTN|nr:TetR/AcrR family transcriptional regulator [Paraconexibacter antarcticus]UTI66589.1 TetR/AcrR family transcriptional regulator [Paraconexibacter antarcticus]